MSIDYIGTDRSEEIGFPGMLRVVFENGALAFGNHDLAVGMERTYAALAGVDWLVAVAPPVVAPGDSVAVMDVQSTMQGEHNTVADIATFLDHASYLTAVRSIERLRPYNPNSATDKAAAAAQRDQAIESAEAQQKSEGIIGQTGAALESAGNKLYALLVVAVIVAILVGWRELRSLIPS